MPATRATTAPRKATGAPKPRRILMRRDSGVAPGGERRPVSALDRSAIETLALAAPWVGALEGNPVQVEESAASEGKASNGRFRGRAYSGGEFCQWWGRVILDLDGYRARSEKVWSLLNHQRQSWTESSRRVGFTTAIAVSTGAQGGVDVDGQYLSGELAQEVRRDGLEGGPWELSLWSEPQRIEFLEEGARATVNGREVIGPITIAREWIIRECSHVELGADPYTRYETMASHARAAGLELDEETFTMAATATRKPKKTPAASTRAKAGAAPAAPPAADAGPIDFAQASDQEIRAALEKHHPQLLASIRAEAGEGESDSEDEGEDDMDEEDDEGEEPSSETQAMLAASGEAASFDQLAILADLGASTEDIVAAHRGKHTLARACYDLARKHAAESATLRATLKVVKARLGEDPVGDAAGDKREKAKGGGAATLATLKAGEAFPDASDSHGPEQAWEASASLRSYWTAQMGGNEPLGKRAFLGHADTCLKNRIPFHVKPA